MIGQLNAHQIAGMIVIGAVIFLVSIDYGFRGLVI